MSYNQATSNYALCVYKGNTGVQTWYGNHNYYSEFKDWFEYASIFMSNSVPSMNKSELQILFDNINKGTGSASLMKVGSPKGQLPLTNLVTLLLILGVFGVFFSAIYNFFRKRLVTSIQWMIQKDNRCLLIPTLLLGFALAIASLLFGIIFLFGTWESYKTMYSKYDSSIHAGMISRPTNLQNEILYQAQCHYDLLFSNGKERLLRLIHDTSDYMADSCKQSIDLLQIKQDQLLLDMDSLTELITQTEDLKKQLKEIEDLKLLSYAEDLALMKITSTALLNIENHLMTINKTVGIVYAKVTENILISKDQEDFLRDDVASITDALLEIFHNSTVQIAQVKKSLDEATRSLAAFVKTVAIRFMSFMEAEKGKGDPFFLYIAVQGIVGSATIIGTLALIGGILVYSTAICNPRAIYFNRSTIGWICQLFLALFCLLGAFTFSVLFLSGTILSFIGPVTTVCDAMHRPDVRNHTADFFSVNGIHFQIKDFNGTVHPIAFGDFIKTEKMSDAGLASEFINGFGDLLPEFGDLLDMEKFIDDLEFVKDPALPSTSTVDFSQLADQLKDTAAAVKEVNVSDFHSEKARSSPLLRLIAKEFHSFKRSLERQSFRSLKASNILGCRIRHIPDQTRDALIMGLNSSFREFKRLMDKELYKNNKFIDTYFGSTSLLCVDYLVASTGCWMAAILLGISLLCTMVYVNKIIQFLNSIPRPGEVLEDQEEQGTPLQSLDSPLLEDKPSDSSTLATEA